MSRKRTREEDDNTNLSELLTLLGWDLFRMLARVCTLTPSGHELLFVLRQVCAHTYAIIKETMRLILWPRYEALLGAFAAWRSAPWMERFPFPQPRGPLPLNWVHLCENGSRNGARPLPAQEGERAWHRPLFVWAVSYALPFGPQKVDLQRAMDAVPDKRGDWIIEQIQQDGWGASKDAIVEHSVPAFIATWPLSHKNIGEPGNQGRFLSALVEQIPSPEEALAFFIFWAQHTTFQTWVIDDTFLSNGVELAVIRVLLPWRGLGEMPQTWHCGDYNTAFRYWFGTRADELAYRPWCLSYPQESLFAPDARTKNREALLKVQAAFDDPETRARMLSRCYKRDDIGYRAERMTSLLAVLSAAPVL